MSLVYTTFTRSPQIPISTADEEDIICATVFATLFTMHNGLISQFEVLCIKEQILVLFEWVYISFEELHCSITVNELYQFTLSGKLVNVFRRNWCFKVPLLLFWIKVSWSKNGSYECIAKVKQWPREQMYGFWQFHWFVSKYDFQMHSLCFNSSKNYLEKF